MEVDNQCVEIMEVDKELENIENIKTEESESGKLAMEKLDKQKMEKEKFEKEHLERRRKLAEKYNRCACRDETIKSNAVDGTKEKSKEDNIVHKKIIAPVYTELKFDDDCKDLIVKDEDGCIEYVFFVRGTEQEEITWECDGKCIWGMGITFGKTSNKIVSTKCKMVVMLDLFYNDTVDLKPIEDLHLNDNNDEKTATENKMEEDTQKVKADNGNSESKPNKKKKRKTVCCLDEWMKDKLLNDEMCRFCSIISTDETLPINEYPFLVHVDKSEDETYTFGYTCKTNCKECRKIASTVSNLKKLTEFKAKLFLKSLENEAIQPEVMMSLRRLFSESIDEKFHLKLTQADFESILQIGVDLNVPQIISDIILRYRGKNLKDKEIAEYLTDALWVLTNISSGIEGQTLAVIDAGSLAFVEEIITNVENVNLGLFTQCIMLISNVLVDDILLLNKIISDGIFKTVYRIFHRVDVDCQCQIAHFYFSITKTFGEDISETLVSKMILQVGSLLKPGTDGRVLRSILDLIHERSKHGGTNYMHLDIFLENGYANKLIYLMTDSDHSIQNKTLMCLGNLLLGNMSRTEKAVKNGLIPNLVGILLQRSDVEVIKHCLWMLSNIATEGPSFCQIFFDYDIVPYVLYYITCKEPKVAIEALWTLQNVVDISDNEQKDKYILCNKDIYCTLAKVFGLKAEEMQPPTTPNYQYIVLVVDTLESIHKHLILNHDYDSDEDSPTCQCIKKQAHEFIKGSKILTILHGKLHENVQHRITARIENLYEQLMNEVYPERFLPSP